jgi:hypothetical protein
VDTSDPEVRSMFEKHVSDEEAGRKRLLRRLSIDEVPVRTDTGYMQPLLRFFRARETRVRSR